MDREELIVGGVGLLGAYGIAEMFYQTAQSAYEPLIEVAKGYVNGKQVNLKTSYFSHDLKVWSDEVSFDLAQIIKILSISKTVAMSSAFYVSAIETSINFLRAWKGQGNRPFVVDIMEGGIRGSIVGLAMSFFKRDQDYQGVQIATGVMIGYAVGMTGAFIGSVGGCIAHAMMYPTLKSIDEKLQKIGDIVVT